MLANKGGSRGVSDLEPRLTIEMEIGGASRTTPAGCVDADGQGITRVSENDYAYY